MQHISAMEIFCEHLEKILFIERTLKETARKIGVSESCLKSWLAQKRAPSIRSLDRVADHIGCPTYQLVRRYPLEYGGNYLNNSHSALRKNLEAFFIKHQRFSMLQKLSLLQNEISDLSLTSYLRTKNYRLPTLHKLETIAQVLGVEAYELLFWED